MEFLPILTLQMITFSSPHVIFFDVCFASHFSVLSQGGHFCSLKVVIAFTFSIVSFFQVCRQCHGAGFTDRAKMAFSVQLLAGHRHC